MNLPRLLCLLAGSVTALTAAEPASPAREAIHEMMVAHAVYAPSIAAPKPTVLAALPAPFRVEEASPAIPAHPLRENPVDRFFRTGVLLADRPEQPVDKLSFGPCEGGKLLNLRSTW